MVWNLQFQCAALLIVLVVAAMCLGQKRLNFTAEREYSKLLLFVIISVLADILSVFAINYIDDIGVRITNVACKFYLITIAVVGYQSMRFALAEIRYTLRKLLGWIMVFPLIVETVSLFILPVHIFNDGSSLYTYGSIVILTYIVCGIYILFTLVMVIVLRKRINVKRKFAIHFWMICWAMVATIQFINNSLLVVSFAMALACMYMYCKLENPEYHLDFATNVFNKKGFSMIMGEHIKYDEKRTLVTVAIGNLNMINEVFGSHVVEQLIVGISGYMDKIPGVTLFRIEDSLFCLSFEKPEDAEKAVEQLQKRFDGQWMAGGVPVEISAFFSFIEDISMFKNVEDLEEVVHYFASESQKKTAGEVLFVNEKELKVRQRGIEIQKALEWALKNDGVEVYYQPIYNIKEGKFSAAEALVRLRAKDGSIIMPGEFVEFSEKNGMILTLGEIVFRKVCEFFRRMHVEEYGIEYIEVNLSVVQCMQEDMARTLKNIMGEYQIPPYRINFEITETAAVNSQKAIERNMNELIAYGCGFSLDDYGSGYSNLSYVVKLPVKIIKIDKLMVDEYFTSEKTRIATDYTIEMLHKLGMELVVEGVENEEQYMAFKKLGVEYIQGFYFSRPLPKERVLNYIQEWL